MTAARAVVEVAHLAPNPDAPVEARQHDPADRGVELTDGERRVGFVVEVEVVEGEAHVPQVRGVV